MIPLKPIPAGLSVLDQSHIFRGARLILAYADEQGPIPLTPSKAFRRVFVNWAAEAFVWPQWTVEAGIAQSIERLLREDGQNDYADQFKGQVRWLMEVLHGGWWGWDCRAA